jgi:hypothetical protein
MRLTNIAPGKNVVEMMNKTYKNELKENIFHQKRKLYPDPDLN